MAIIKCKMCGGDVELAADKTFGTCEYCGSTMTFPKVEDDQRAAAFNRGNHFRRIGEFDKALAVYERIVREDDTDAEAHWCCALCRFGIEYVEDPATYEWLPTCHRASFDSFLEDVDYLAALENSDGITRRQYQKDAAKIAEVQRGILATSQNAEPYDVFICYKESDAHGDRTRDSLLAQDIYYQLTEQGRKVFFARITLEDVAGTQYEPYIFAALNSAKVMIVVGTQPEYLNAVWVKNEWSRFLAMMKKDRSKLLLPCYRDMDPYDLPEQLSVLQSYDMSKIGFIQDLTRGIAKVLDAEKKPEPVKETVVVQQTKASNASPLLERAFMFLEDGKWDSANEYLERVLDMEPKNGRAYLGKLMAALRVHTEENLRQQTILFQNNDNYKKAVRYGDGQLRQLLEDSIAAISQRCYATAQHMKIHAIDNVAFLKAAEQFEKLAEFRDAQFQAADCRQLAQQWETEQRSAEAERQRLAAQQKAERARLEEERQAVIRRERLENQQLREKLQQVSGFLGAGFNHTVGVKSNGTVAASCYTGDKTCDYNQCDIGHWRNIVAVAASWGHTVGLKNDGTASAAGDNSIGQCNLGIWNDLVAISAGTVHSVGLKDNGTVVTAGDNQDGQCDTDNWENIIAISAGNSHTVGLREDGTVVATRYSGDDYEGQCEVGSWRDIVAISAGSGHTVGLKADGTVVATKYVGEDYEGQCEVDSWRDIVAISAGSGHTVGLKADGTVVATEYFGEEYDGQCEVASWRDIVAISAGDYHTIGLKNDGTLVSTGANDSGQCEVNHWRLFCDFENLVVEQTQEVGLLEIEEKRLRIQGGLCQHCGGTFKGLFGKKCAACGKPKDY